MKECKFCNINEFTNDYTGIPGEMNSVISKSNNILMTIHFIPCKKECKYYLICTTEDDEIAIEIKNCPFCGRKLYKKGKRNMFPIEKCSTCWNRDNDMRGFFCNVGDPKICGEECESYEENTEEKEIKSNFLRKKLAEKKTVTLILDKLGEEKKEELIEYIIKNDISIRDYLG